ncbi:DUF362 domain-containing protein [Halomarina halobia]|uniref:DUF362 domain-containing protein n=1 Tax=Halomarina halobia TaxID=3033386 RepID=A0ABD6AFZ6_9EURY|nr:DUF362 domain-containing protein [Halomarina sp. PSR21]
MTPRVSGRRVDGTAASLAGAVMDLLDDAPPAGRALVVPDVHYPFHPSTGLVTDPGVVGVLIEFLQGRGTEVLLCYPDSPWVAGDRCAAFLGYDEVVDRLGVDVLDLDAAGSVERTVTIGDSRRRVTVPEPLDSETLVTVPTLRTDPDHGFVAGMAATALGALGADAADATAEDVVAAAAVCDPAAVLLDGTYTYTGAPHRSGFLLASSDAPTLDAAAARLVNEDPEEVPYLAPHGVRTPPVAGLDLDEIADRLPNEREETGETSPVMQTGYRLYSRVTGDLLPPQFMGDPDA